MSSNGIICVDTYDPSTAWKVAIVLADAGVEEPLNVAADVLAALTEVRQ